MLFVVTTKLTVITFKKSAAGVLYDTSCDTRALHGSPILSIPLEAHHKAQSSEIFLSFLVKNLKSCDFFLLANPAETAYLSFRD